MKSGGSASTLPSGAKSARAVPPSSSGATPPTAISTVQVVPLTTNTDKLYEAYVTLGDHKSKALADQLTTVSKKRFRDRIGFLFS